MTISLLLAALTTLTPTQGPERPALFLAPVGSPDLPAEGEFVLRQRAVVVAAELLADAAAAAGRELQLATFEGQDLVLRDVSATSLRNGAASFHGELANPAGERVGEADFAVVADSVAGTLRFGARLVNLEPAAGSSHLLVEIDELALPECATHGRHLVNDPSVAGGGSKSALSATAPLVDVMVVYTTLAKNGQGGTNGILARINLAITETNNGYAASDVNQRLRLVHTEELVGYTENGNFSTELNRLTNKNDSWFDSIHATRDAVGADAVSMIINGSSSCGIAWLMGNPSHNFENKAFSVVARTCSTGYYSFGHELGHNMGSHHDIANAGGGASYNYSYGWRTANGAFRTIMAYAPGTRVNRWSNPSKTWNGQVLGSTNQAENWKSLNNTASTTSQWRCAVPENFGFPKPTSALTFGNIAFSGKPVANGSGNFKLRVEGALPGNPAIVFYGTTSNSMPFLGGTLYVGTPFTRLPAVILDGNGNGEWAFPITSFSPGDEIYAQGWFRDPAQVDGTGSGLTGGLRIDVCQFNQ